MKATKLISALRKRCNTGADRIKVADIAESKILRQLKRIENAQGASDE